MNFRFNKRIGSYIVLKPTSICVLCLLLWGCEKKCTTTAGNMDKKIIPLTVFFDRLEVRDDINLELIPDTVDMVVIEAGENLLPNIICETIDSVVYIYNNNQCNWIRGYDDVLQARMHFKNPKFYKMLRRGSGNLTCSDTLKRSAWVIDAANAFGYVELTVDCRYVYVGSASGASDYKVTGKTLQADYFTRGYGIMDCSGVQADKVIIKHEGTNNVYLVANKSLNASIRYIGNIYYKGNATDITIEQIGKGELIKQ